MNYTVTEDQATGLFIVADELGEFDRVDSEEMGWDIVRMLRRTGGAKRDCIPPGGNDRRHGI
jgi:hypothetical protein